MGKTDDPSRDGELPTNGPGPAERIGCPDCGLVQWLSLPGTGHVAECSRCGRVLAGRATGQIGLPLALTLAALLLFLPVLLQPLMGVSTFGAARTALLSSSSTALWRDGFPSLGVLVCLFSIVLPLLYLMLLVGVLGSLHLGLAAPVGPAFRWSKHLRPWVMIEVYLLGCFVAYSRIKVMTAVDVGSGGWCLLAAALLLLVALTQLDERTVWAKLRPQEPPSPGHATISCTVCDLIVPMAGTTICPRCGATLELRKHRSTARTAALVLTGYLLYVPANTLPVLTTIRFGREEHNTILSGVIELARNDLWPLAVIVFIASIVLPLIKLFGLTWMLVAIQRRSRQGLGFRTRLYRLIDLVGRWSNIDVFAVSVLVAILQFGELTAVHAGNGLIAFAAVVVITMLATEVFDARLMWDAPGANG